MAAKEQELGAVHVLMTEWCLAVLRSVEKETGRPTATAAEVSVIRAFLKDNDITADAADNGRLAALKEELAKRHSRLKPAALDPVLDLGMEPDSLVQ